MTGIALAVLGVLAPATPAAAATFPVNSTADPGEGTCTTDPGGCTLREAITAANVDSVEDDQIPIQTTGIIDLQSQLPAVSTPTTISGPGQQNLTIRRQTGTFVVLATAPPMDTTVRIEGVRLADGTSGLAASGPGRTEVDRVWIRGNVTNLGAGGGVVAGSGSVSISNSTISGNVANGGGGIFATGTAFIGIINSTIAGNSTPDAGGGIISDSNATVEISSSTVVGNTADSDNTGSGTGGGLSDGAAGTVFGEFRIANTIVADNRVGTTAPVQNQCAGGTFDSYGYNLLSTDDMNCTGFDDTTDRFNPNPLIGALAQDGLPTPVIPLLAGSPAIDAGYTNVGPLPFVAPCPASDQRGLPRGGSNGPCDIGAFEFQKPLPPSAGIAEVLSAKLMGKRLVLQVSCPAGSNCDTNTVSLVTKKKTKAAKIATAAKRKRLSLGKKQTFSLVAGQTATIRTKLSKKARKLLRSKRKVPARVTITAGSQTSVKTIVVKGRMKR